MDRDFLIELFADFGPVAIRRMFSGFGISADGTNFALALRGGLYLRADEQTIPQFEAEGSKPFQYQTRAKTVVVNSYWQLPERLYDDPEEMTGWARAGVIGRPARRVAQAEGAQGREEGCGQKGGCEKIDRQEAGREEGTEKSEEGPEKKILILRA
jgi:DNA transformation protein